MFARRILYSILIVTLTIQLFPTNSAGRFLMLDLPDDEYSDMVGSKAMRQLAEEEHKEIHIQHEWITIPFVNINNSTFHFSESLPIPHPGAVHTPPPNIILA